MSARSIGPQMMGDAGGGEPWGARLWLALAVVLVLVAPLQLYGIRTWPMADDEVPSLVELGLLQTNAAAYYSSPAGQIAKLPKATIVWNTVQRAALRVLPASEVSYRVPSVICGILTVALAFVVAARWRGLWFAAALSIVIGGTPLFIYLSQLDRFYALALLLLGVTFTCLWWPRNGPVPIVMTAVLTALTVLSHNLTVAAFGLAFGASVATWFLGLTPWRVVVRSGVALLTGGLIYVFYLLPLVRGWQSTGNPTPVLVSFAAYAGMPLIALTMFGAVLTAMRRDSTSLAWWVVFGAGSLCLFVGTSISWNPRYFIFFLPALWILGAHAMDVVARRIGLGVAGAAWYACVALLLAPALASHFIDGTRHDYRAAAAVVRTADTTADPILSDDAETISYYLPSELRTVLQVRTKVTTYPASQFFLVYRMNAWMPLPRLPGRRVDLLAEISRRRFDQFSHILRIYRVRPLAEAP